MIFTRLGAFQSRADASEQSILNKRSAPVANDALSQSASPNAVNTRHMDVRDQTGGIADIGGCQVIRRGWEGLDPESHRLHETHYSVANGLITSTRLYGRLIQFDIGMRFGDRSVNKARPVPDEQVVYIPVASPVLPARLDLYDYACHPALRSSIGPHPCEHAHEKTFVEELVADAPPTFDDGFFLTEFNIFDCARLARPRRATFVHLLSSLLRREQWA
jgi:hypothetical protein